ncbi:MAG TPA: 2-phosphoglycerate kinase [Coriobacteriia bacterium]|nr:2-phosphoglycerate kinase [Coriobacteriia bacterium]
MPQQGPPILIKDKKHGLPYSKGLMAQSFTACGLPPSRAYLVAQKIQDDLRERAVSEIALEELEAMATSMLQEQAGEDYARRYRRLRELSRADRPLVILIGGTTGVGKSTIATEIAHRLGITRIVSTDSIREVMRGIFARDLMPAIYESSFNAWRGLRVPVPHGANPVIVGFREQTAVVLTAIRALVDRAVVEGESIVVEGVHVVPGYIEPSQFQNASVVSLLIAVDDEESHRSHFYIREVQTDGTRPFEKYRANFDNIRLLGAYIEDLAIEHGVPIVRSHQLDRTVAEVLELVVDTAIRDDEDSTVRRAAPARGA